MMIKFDGTQKQQKFAADILRKKNLNEIKSKNDIQEHVMDLIATHNHCQKLDFKKLLESSEFDFLHDIFGIRKNLDRIEIVLKNNFLPRCSQKETKKL